jgi:hypothetical protein
MLFYSTLNQLYSLIQNENLRSMKRLAKRHRKDREGRPSYVIKKFKSKIREELEKFKISFLENVVPARYLGYKNKIIQ